MLTATGAPDAAGVIATVTAGGPADATVPVGQGRRRFLRGLLERARSSDAADRLLLVVGRPDLIRLWQRDLAATFAPQAVDLVGSGREGWPADRPVLIGSPRCALALLVAADLKRTIVVVDEPDVAARTPGLTEAMASRPYVRLWLTAPPGPKPSTPSPVRATLSPFDHDVGRLVAGLIDGELERRLPRTFLRWSATMLGTPADRLQHMRQIAEGANLDLIAYLVGAQLNQASDLSAAGGDDNPRWRTLDLPDEPVALPESLRAYFPAGSLLDVECTLEIDPTEERAYVSIATAEGNPARTAQQFVADLIDGRGLPDHPYRGHTLDVTITKRHLAVRAIAPPADTREQLVLHDAVWADIDRNVHGLLRNRRLLAQLGLGVNRGLLLHGPPGTGKTQLVRTIAAELHGQATTLFLSAEVMRTRLADAYQLAQQLTPAMVVLEDADLVVGHRARGGSSALVEFLTSVDGLMTDHSGVLTIATTNDPDALDPAALRSARFDRIIEIPNPPAVGRRRIWERYLADIPGWFDIEQLVRLTNGASGADIRELVRHAILDSDGDVSHDVLTRLTAECRSRERPGLYL